MLFPPGAPSRVPVIAVTGTNGKTTTTRLIAHIAKNSGKTVGFTTTEGIYIGNSLIQPATTPAPSPRNSSSKTRPSKSPSSKRRAAASSVRA
jgi:UDP-N-acetylmuramyl tripeptide synthase